VIQKQTEFKYHLILKCQLGIRMSKFIILLETKNTSNKNMRQKVLVMRKKESLNWARQNHLI